MSDVAAPEAEAAQEKTEKNDANALFTLGMRYSIGRDVDHDPIAAHKWFNLAAMMGHEEALSARAELAREMSTEQVAEAQRQARAWMWKQEEPSSEGKTEKPAAAVRPIYVRRRAEALRSAKAFARIVA